MCKRITLFAIIALALLIQPQPLLSSPSPDFDGDGVVDTADFLLFVQHFGTAEERYDLNADGTVDAADFLKKSLLNKSTSAQALKLQRAVFCRGSPPSWDGSSP